MEIVAIFVSLFKDHELHVKRLENETQQESLARLSRVLNEVDFQVLLRMRDADQVQFIYKKV